MPFGARCSSSRFRSRFAGIVILSVAVHAPVLRAQGLPDFPSESQVLVETPGTSNSIAAGLFNPAAWSMQRTGGVFFSWDDAVTDLNRGAWAGIVSLRNVSFGVHQFDFEPSARDRYHVRDYTIGVGGGSPAHAWGLAYAWAAGDLERQPRHERLILGDIYRCRYASLGAASTWDLERRDNQFQVDLGLRPLGPRATLFADAVYERGQDFADIRSGYGIEVWPLRGLAVAAHARSTGEVSLRVTLGINRNTRFSHRMHLDEDGDRTASTYSFEAGAPRAVARDIFRPSGRRFPEFALRGPVVYQRYRLFDGKRTLLETLRQLDALADDPAVGGVVINLSGARWGAEMAWELRDQLAALRARGKRVIVYIDNARMIQLALASVADQVWLDPAGGIDMRGLATGRTYMRHAFDKMGLGVDEWRFFTYKSAFEGYSRDSMSQPDREQRQALIDDFYDTIAGATASARGLSRAQFDALVNGKGVLLAAEAQAAGLVDSLGDFAAVRRAAARAARRPTADGPVEPLGQVAGDPDWRSEEWGAAPRIAVLYGIGECAMDTGIRGPVLAKAIRDAASDRHVKAIVLRADSPGGEILPSDLVAREVRAASKKKPVLVSQGQVAASGGYWISMDADTIVASPLTITGSIGVIGGWVWNKGLGEKIGFDYDGVKHGEHADALNGITLPLVGQSIPDRPLTADERDRVEQLIRSSYKTFVAKVAAGRGMDEAGVDAIGQGHVYSGTRGRDIGLVDEIGGLWTTIGLAKRAARIPAARGVELTTGPGSRLVDWSGLRPRLFGALFGRSNAGTPAAGSTGTTILDTDAGLTAGMPLSRLELDFLRTLVRANGKPLVIIDPLEIHDGAADR